MKNTGSTIVRVALVILCIFAQPMHAQSQGNNVPRAACPVSDRNHQATARIEYHTCRKGGGRDALWSAAKECAKDVRSDSNCVLHATQTNEDYAIIKDCNLAKKHHAYLLVPLDCVKGVDDPLIFSSPFVNLWEDAWLWSRVYPGKPSFRTGLVVNSSSPKARTQDQLHVHLSCVHKDVSDALHAKSVPAYTGTPVTPAEMKDLKNGNTYYAVKVTGLTGRNSPFEVVLAMGVKKEDMKDQGIAAVGTEREGEYYVLYTTVAGSNDGFAEELLDQECTDTW